MGNSASSIEDLQAQVAARVADEEKLVDIVPCCVLINDAKPFWDKSTAGKIFVKDNVQQNMINIIPVCEKLSNYWTYCTPVWEGVLSTSEKQLLLKSYTGSGYKELNFSLLFDIEKKLKKNGTTIRKMKRAIRDLNHTTDITVYRYLQMTQEEVQMMKDVGVFFIANFVSASKKPECTSCFSWMNTVLVIHKPANAGFCADVEVLSQYPEEHEILLSCYNVYIYERHEIVEGRTRVYITVADYHKYCQKAERVLKK
eukprot:TRINITY_DN4145_c0_g1_i1.p1 TRINITY_DN4145_c0_g1~~TRINITY_DN4145_c0_g1_i1.p1  ORF type:complete len:256 (-),score=68.07 TRINITY_DN4145_c0_g1_i1:64-831(-)